MASGAWTEAETALLKAAYEIGRPLVDLAAELGRTRAAVRNQAYKLKITKRDDNWSEAEISALREAYSGSPRRGELNLKSLAETFGRSHIALCTKARKLGLTSTARGGIRKAKADKRKYATDAERSAALSHRMIEQHKQQGHPFKGKKHSLEARAKLGVKSAEYWANVSDEDRAAHTMKILQSRLASQGSLAPPRPHASWKAGWREIGGKRNYYRSRWEANYGRYLEWLKAHGQIKDWQHEPETFWFEAIKRGVRSYLPDFRVWENDGSSRLHEVKGWMDSRSKTTLARMKKYHRSETIVLVREREYNAIARQVGGMIEGWEASGRSDRL